VRTGDAARPAGSALSGAYSDLRECDQLNNFFSKVFGFIFRTDRIGNLERIREIGLEAFKAEKASDDRP